MNRENINVIFSIDNEKSYPKLLNFLKDYPVIQINQIEPSLDDIFITLAK